MVRLVAATIAISPSGGTQSCREIAALLTLLGLLPFAGGFAVGGIFAKGVRRLLPWLGTGSYWDATPP